MSVKNSVIIVGGGIMGVQTAYHLALLGHTVTILDQRDVPNQWAASGDHLRVPPHLRQGLSTPRWRSRPPMWLELNVSPRKRLLQNGVLELAPKAAAEAQSMAVLKERKVRFEKLAPPDVKKRYPMYRSGAFKWALFHQDGGMIWASRAVAATASVAQRKGVKIRNGVRVVSIQKDKTGIKSVKDATGKTWEADKFLFAAGYWSNELLKPWACRSNHQAGAVVLKTSGGPRPLLPRAFPRFREPGRRFYGFPVHIQGFIKIGDHRKGPVVKAANPDEMRSLSPKFEASCRKFLKQFMPELAGFIDFEGHVCWYDNTPDDDFILDRLPDAPNGFVAAGFSGHGFKFAPFIGKSMAELIVGGKSELNLHRFRLGRFKLKKA